MPLPSVHTPGIKAYSHTALPLTVTNTSVLLLLRLNFSPLLFLLLFLDRTLNSLPMEFFLFQFANPLRLFGVHGGNARTNFSTIISARRSSFGFSLLLHLLSFLAVFDLLAEEIFFSSIKENAHCAPSSSFWNLNCARSSLPGVRGIAEKEGKKKEKKRSDQNSEGEEVGHVREVLVEDLLGCMYSRMPTTRDKHIYLPPHVRGAHTEKRT